MLEIERMKKFNSIIEEVKELSIEEKEELQLLLEKYLIEARRDEIKNNHQKSVKEKNLKFSNNIKDLKAGL